MRVARLSSSATVALLTLAALAGCVPQRNNGFDPSNAPAVNGAVVDLTLGDGVTCGAIGPYGMRPLVASASRGRCLALDARGTTDPQQTLPGALTFSFTAPACDGTETDAFDEAIAATNGVIVLRREFLRTCPLSERLAFGVRAKDPSGAVGVGTIELVLENAAPIAAANRPRVIPVGGFPWSPGPVTLTFSGEGTTDPDGPSEAAAHTFEWTFPPNAAGEPTTVLGKTVTRSIDTNLSRRVVAVLRVSDGKTVSAPAFASVGVRAPSPWAYDGGEGTSQYELLDPLREILDTTYLGTSGQAQATLFANGSRIAIVSPAPSNANVLRTSPFPATGALSSPVTLPLQQSMPFASLDSERVWVVGLSGTSAIVRAFEPFPTDTGLSVDLGPNFGNDGNFFAAEDSNGNAWVTSFLGAHVARVDGQTGSSLDWYAGDGRIITGFGIRPAGSEVWVLTIPDLLSGTAVVGSAQLHRFDLSGVELTPIDLGVTYAFSFAFADDRSAWLHADGVGLVLADADLLVSGVPLEGAARSAIESDLIFNLVVDPATGDCWAFGTGGTAILAHQDGSYVTVPLDQTFDPLFIDEEGALWFTGGDAVLSRAFTPGDQGVLLRAALGFAFPPAFDIQTGGFWTSVYVPPALVNMSISGTMHERILQVTGPTGTPELLPIVALVSPSPDGQSLWGITAVGGDTESFIDRFDRIAGGWQRTRVLDNPTLCSEILGGNRLFEPSIPVAGQEPFLWFSRIQGSITPLNASLGQVRDGVATPHFGIPNTERVEFGKFVLRTAMSPVTSGVCLATWQRVDAVSAGTIRLRRIAPAIANVNATPIGTLTSAAGSTGNGDYLDVGAAHDPATGRDVCWAVFSDDAIPSTGDSFQILVADQTGATIHTYTSPAGEFVQSLTADSPHRAWLVVRVVSGGITRVVKRRLEFTPGMVSQLAGPPVELAPTQASPELSSFGDPGSRSF